MICLGFPSFSQLLSLRIQTETCIFYTPACLAPPALYITKGTTEDNWQTQTKAKKYQRQTFGSRETKCGGRSHVP